MVKRDYSSALEHVSLTLELENRGAALSRELLERQAKSYGEEHKACKRGRRFSSGLS